MASVDVAVVGNGIFGALVDRYGRFVWCCMDTYDGDPVFNCLLNNNSDKTGFWDVLLQDFERAEQQYIETSAVLTTTLHSCHGDSVEIRDFAPRFMHFDRTFRPFQLIRTIKRVKGDPRVTIRIRPTFQYNSTDGYQTRGSQHVRFCGPTHTWRATTNTSIRHILEEMPFLVPSEPVFVVFGTDESFANSLIDVCQDFERKTIGYWKEWCCSLCLPVEFQEVLVRAAMTVGIMQSEDSGGFLSALTVGVPLGPLCGPTRDTRVCRLLDECLALPVLRDLGLFDVCKKFLVFIKEICFMQSKPQHTYNSWGSVQERKKEWAPYLAGYRGMGEVHSGGPLVEPPPTMERGGSGGGSDEWHSRTVVHGLLVISLAHAFFDIRLSGELCTPKLFEKLELYALHACDSFGQMLQLYRAYSASGAGSGPTRERPPSGAAYYDDVRDFLLCKDDRHAGPRVSPAVASTIDPDERPSVHTLTSVLCWAAADRLRRIAAHFFRNAERAEYWQRRAVEMHEGICRYAWSPRRGAFSTFWGGDTVGPSLLRLAEVGFIMPEDSRFRGTVLAFEQDATACAVCVGSADGRPATVDELGGEALLESSSTCFMTNTLLWYCEALRSIGSVHESRRILEALVRCSTHRGILTESIDLRTAEFWGNAPSLASLLSLLRVAPRMSRSWREV